jgi:ribonuclease P protein component
MPRFRKFEHLRKPAEFKAVYDQRRSAADAIVIVYAKENGLTHCRLGLSVSRKFGGAVQRNRLRRLFREAFRLNKHEFARALDLVIIPRSGEEPAFEDVCRSLIKLVKQLCRRFTSEPKA